MATKPIKIEITGDASKFDKELKSTSDKLGKFTKVAAIGAAAVGTAAVAAGAFLFQVGSDFDEMKNNIVKGTGASGEALDDLFDSAKTVMENVPDSGEVISTALADVNTFFGATGDELEELTESMLDFSRLTDTDVAANIEGLDGVMTSFNLTTEDADELMGDLIRTSQATGVPMEALITTIDKYGPSFAAAGLSAEQAAIMVGEFNTAGLDSEATGKILDKVLLDAAESGITAEEAMGNLDEQLSAMTGPERLAAMELMVGGRNASQAVAAWEAGALNMEQINESVADGAGILDEQTEATATFSDKWNEFKNKVLVKLEPLATKLFEKIEDFMEWLNSDGIPAVEGLVATFQEFAGWLRANSDYVIGVLAALATLIVITLGPAFVVWAIGAASAAAATILALAPIIAITLAVAALAVGVVWLWKNWDEIWAKIKKLTGQVVDWIQKKITDGWNAVKTRFTDMKNKAIAIFNSLKDAVVQRAKDLVADVVGWITDLPQKVKDLGSKFLDAGKAVGGKIIEGIKSGLTAAVGFAGDVASGVWRAVKNAVNTNVVDKINNAIPNSIPIKGLPDINLPDNPVPRLFKGATDFAGGVAMVGEHGRELVTLPEGSNVLTNANTERVMAGNTTTQAITVNVQTNADPQAIARELAWQLRRG